jgi:hypothetical protein
VTSFSIFIVSQSRLSLLIQHCSSLLHPSSTVNDSSDYTVPKEINQYHLCTKHQCISNLISICKLRPLCYLPRVLKLNQPAKSIFCVISNEANA